MEAQLVYPSRLEKYARRLLDELVKRGYSVSASVLERIEEAQAKFVVILGLDREILQALHSLPYETTVLPVAPPSYTGYIALTPMDKCAQVLELLERGRVTPLRLPVLSAFVDGTKTVRAVNEVAVFPRRSATLLEYDLEVNGDFLWHDTSDGLIVATPLGSTAYALSAGGPVVLLDAEALVIISVNSVEPGRRPVVAHLRSSIRVGGVSSRTSVEVIADGVERVEVEEEVRIGVAGYLNMVVAEDRGTALAKRKFTYEELRELPPSAKFVLKVLEDEGELGISEIIDLTGLPERTVRHALALLSSRGFIEKLEDPVNPKRILYRVSRK
ncbi:NAD(+)/NADH kinase [Infirmifilum lucidum]|uniref:NAD(+)/NADH kinase n=1 Tax=Infirmifilum lucidum TaxID=2776706 RepID=A0A7L9FFV9_9CREN|nr:NAD(+)/NADH kinase [Infirmifilum lucidum]QOJ78698.1 NAD(+)/NADH kinase [Infirmifilum lucidum]